jgi:hypothetical protein
VLGRDRHFAAERVHATARMVVCPYDTFLGSARGQDDREPAALGTIFE